MVRSFPAAAALAAAAWLCAAARADVHPHALFSDGMVLQQGVTCPVWGRAEPGEEVQVTLQADKAVAEASGKADEKEGRWRVELPAQKAGGPYTLTIRGKNTVTVNDVLVGEVWVCSGQSNMEWPVRFAAEAKQTIESANHPRLRLFTVPHRIRDTPMRGVKGKWAECSPTTVAGFSAVAYHFGRHLQEALAVPVGLIQTAWGGTVAEAWTSREALQANPELHRLLPQEEDVEPGNPNQGTVLFNGMVAPLIPYAIKGAIWYQGEANVGRAWQYRTLFPVMIKSWRDAWGQGDFPFLFVQLAPFLPIRQLPSESAWAELRDAQLHTSRTVPNTAMAVITDLGDPNDIHPKQKEPVGARLCLAARALAYGEKIEYSGPLYESMTVDGNRAVLGFTHLGKGLETRYGAVHGFTVAGEDRKFYNALAEVRGDKVVVWTDRVDKPVAVRFGWWNCPLCDLWNKDALPASPFRTDEFPLTTQPRRPAK
jgi:sialate O-acetylesterase